MSCPFAKFASIVPLHSTKMGDFHAHHTAPTPSSGTLSDALRTGTAVSHRLVERSVGVSLLLNPTSSTSVHFDRVDYVRFNIMLCCVYVVLEASLVRARAGVEPLFEGGLMRELARSGALVDDVREHLEVVEVHSGASLADLAAQAREEASEEDEKVKQKLFDLVSASLPFASHLSPSPEVLKVLTRDHIALLDPTQSHATLRYASRLPHLPPPLLLAHAYTRYLGDLSGGQHIVRKVSKRFPCPHNGFIFYHFQATDLKPRFKTALEHCTVTDRAAVVKEANTSFELNTGLFESLLPPELRLPEEAVQIKQSASDGRSKRDTLVLAALVAVSLVYVFNYVTATRKAVVSV